MYKNPTVVMMGCDRTDLFMIWQKCCAVTHVFFTHLIQYELQSISVYKPTFILIFILALERHFCTCRLSLLLSFNLPLLSFVIMLTSFQFSFSYYCFYLGWHFIPGRNVFATLVQSFFYHRVKLPIQTPKKKYNLSIKTWKSSMHPRISGRTALVGQLLYHQPVNTSVVEVFNSNLS